MVRRWSRLNVFNNFNPIYFIFKIDNFKTSVNFKKFSFKITKFKRKNLIKWKHRTNFVSNTYVFKKWISDFFFCKHWFKFQFLNNLFLHCCLVNTSLNSIVKQLPKLTNQNNFSLCHFTKKVLIYNNSKSFIEFYKNYNWNFIFLSTIKNLNSNEKIVPLLNLNEKCFYESQEFTDQIFIFSAINNFSVNLLLLNSVEIYKILNLLFLRHLLKR